MSSMACNGVRSEADGATNGATDGPFFRLPNEFAGDFVEGSLRVSIHWQVEPSAS